MIVFRNVDKSTEGLPVPAIANGYSMSEWLTIARIRDRDAYNVVIEGMNSYSTEEFYKSISINF